jgi:hypothetical protein
MENLRLLIVILLQIIGFYFILQGRFYYEKHFNNISQAPEKYV